MSNRKQRRTQQKLLRKHPAAVSGDLAKVAELLQQVEGHKESISTSLQEAKGGIKFAHLLVKIDEEMDLSDILDEEDNAILDQARKVVG